MAGHVSGGAGSWAAQRAAARRAAMAKACRGASGCTPPVARVDARVAARQCDEDERACRSASATAIYVLQSGLYVLVCRLVSAPRANGAQRACVRVRPSFELGRV